MTILMHFHIEVFLRMGNSYGHIFSGHQKRAGR